MIEIFGYIAAFVMGLTLGSIGGGGSILTVPILVYMMGVSPVVATGYSLLIVGSVALFGAFRYFKQGLIDVKPALLFAVPSIVAVYITRAFIMPAIPDPIISEPFVVSKDLAIMVFFAVLMVLAAVMMLRNSTDLKPKNGEHHYFLVIIEGAIVGIATGILGAGGGFLIIPALVLLMGMPMKRAVGASLLIIALKSLIGFIGDIQSGIAFQLPMLMYFFAATIAGMWIATVIAKDIDGDKLQKIFAYFTLIIAAVILFKELI
ncbi:sulfite exporter TauE/SafE family protein [Marinicella sp. S1101]|uniref:sulfite exporter TauE/SafE family protein n=1 Tax=Marinicella marina TaxID=2996016 RepID=UPI002260C5AC|nr:sulfite exporter TauE/SafE family protein [Marinicella marina]MCX7554187.1 sulfite exporter TauE/SafE family protein [Marinicella marina]MDJ1141120.1 sulfite exporter TauE/SafE family protein [Marinicella marina]